MSGAIKSTFIFSNSQLYYRLCAAARRPAEVSCVHLW